MVSSACWLLLHKRGARRSWERGFVGTPPQWKGRMERSDHPRSGTPHESRFGTTAFHGNSNWPTPHSNVLDREFAGISNRETWNREWPQSQKESLKLVLCVYPPDSTLLDTLFAALFHRLWVWYRPPIHILSGRHESVFNDSLWVTVGARTQTQKQSSSVSAGPSPYAWLDPCPGMGRDPRGSMVPPLQIDPGPHESVFNDSPWVHGCQGKRVSAWRNGSARFNSGSLGGN